MPATRGFEGQVYTPEGGWVHVIEAGYPASLTWGNIKPIADTVYQPLDGDLSAIAAIGASYGFLIKTGLNTWGIDPTTYQPLDTDLTNIAGLGTAAGYLSTDGTHGWSVSLTLAPNQINYNVALANPAWAEGQSYWDMDEHALATDTDISGINCHLGREIIVHVVNKTGVTIAAHQMVYVSGAQGNRPTITLAKADAELTSTKTIGMTVAAIADNAESYVMLLGTHRGVDTTAFTAGDALWLSAATAGGLTATRPAAPNHAVFVGYALNSTANGTIFLHIENGYEIAELHNVDATPPSDGQVLQWVAATGLYTPTTPAAAGGSSRAYAARHG